MNNSEGVLIQTLEEEKKFFCEGPEQVLNSPVNALPVPMFPVYTYTIIITTWYHNCVTELSTLQII